MAEKSAGAALRGLFSQLTGLTRTRLELLGLEALDFRDRLLGRLALLLAAAFLFLVALLVATSAFALYVWPHEYRFTALGLLALLYAVVGAGLALWLRHLLHTDPNPFSATLDVLKEDAGALSGNHPASSGASGDAEQAAPSSSDADGHSGGRPAPSDTRYVPPQAPYSEGNNPEPPSSGAAS